MTIVDNAKYVKKKQPEEILRQKENYYTDWEA